MVMTPGLASGDLCTTFPSSSPASFMRVHATFNCASSFVSKSWLEQRFPSTNDRVYQDSFVLLGEHLAYPEHPD